MHFASSPPYTVTPELSQQLLPPFHHPYQGLVHRLPIVGVRDPSSTKSSKPFPLRFDVIQGRVERIIAHASREDGPSGGIPADLFYGVRKRHIYP